MPKRKSSNFVGRQTNCKRNLRRHKQYDGNKDEQSNGQEVIKSEPQEKAITENVIKNNEEAIETVLIKNECLGFDDNEELSGCGTSIDTSGSSYHKIKCEQNKKYIKPEAHLCNFFKTEIITGKSEQQFSLIKDTLIKRMIEPNPENIWTLEESIITPNPWLREIATIVLAANAIGQRLPPLIVYKGKKLVSSMKSSIGAYHGMTYNVTPSGHMESDTFEGYFREMFIPELKSVCSETRPILVIYSGHSENVTDKLLKYSVYKKTFLLNLPAEAGNFQHPLNVSFIKFYRKNWEKYSNVQWIKKCTFADFLGASWLRFSSDIIRDAFRRTGIYPFDPRKGEVNFTQEVFDEWERRQLEIDGKGTLHQELAQNDNINTEVEAVRGEKVELLAPRTEMALIKGPTVSYITRIPDNHSIIQNSTAESSHQMIRCYVKKKDTKPKNTEEILNQIDKDKLNPTVKEKKSPKPNIKTPCQDYILLYKAVRERNIRTRPENIWTITEANVLINSKALKAVDNKEPATILLAANALGKKRPPFIIYQGYSLKEKWKAPPHICPGIKYTVSDDGAVNVDILKNYLKYFFIPQLDKERPVLVLYSGKPENVPRVMVKLQASKKINILNLPADYGDIQYPLHVSFFTFFKQKWIEYEDTWHDLNGQYKCIPRIDFAKCLAETWTQFSSDIINEAFKKTGLFPFTLRAGDNVSKEGLDEWEKQQMDTKINIQDPPDENIINNQIVDLKFGLIDDDNSEFIQPTSTGQSYGPSKESCGVSIPLVSNITSVKQELTIEYEPEIFVKTEDGTPDLNNQNNTLIESEASIPNSQGVKVIKQEMDIGDIKSEIYENAMPTEQGGLKMLRIFKRVHK